MGLTGLHILIWLLTALTLTTQELATLSVSPKISAQCGQQVTLNCSVSSSRNHLLVRHMGWSLHKRSLCSVESQEKIAYHSRHTTSDFHCEYQHGQLSVIFQRAQPLDNGIYTCKLRSDQGADHKSTTVEIQESCETIEEDTTSGDHILISYDTDALQTRNSVGPRGPLRTCLWTSVVLAAALK